MRIRIPRIGLDQIVVEGTAVDDLRKGPGHYVGTPIAGQIGNTGIAGHRTTYGAPFGELGELETGDEIFVQTLTGDWRYVLTEDPFVVKPSQTVVLLPRTQRNALTGVEETQTTLTLTTCHPKYSAAERLIVNAHLEDAKPPAPPPPLPVASKAPDLGLSGERQSRTPTVLWGLLTLAVGLLWWLWFHRHPRWTTWFTGLIPFADRADGLLLLPRARAPEQLLSLSDPRRSAPASRRTRRAPRAGRRCRRRGPGARAARCGSCRRVHPRPGSAPACSPAR